MQTRPAKKKVEWEINQSTDFSKIFKRFNNNRGAQPPNPTTICLILCVKNQASDQAPFQNNMKIYRIGVQNISCCFENLSPKSGASSHPNHQEYIFLVVPNFLFQHFSRIFSFNVLKSFLSLRAVLAYLLACLTPAKKFSGYAIATYGFFMGPVRILICHIYFKLSKSSHIFRAFLYQNVKYFSLLSNASCIVKLEVFPNNIFQIYEITYKIQ